MRPLLITTFIFIWIGFTSLHGQDTAPYPGIAVVELFTSEGCSSCPPADRVLMDLVSDARDEGLPVYGLSFHVDYWNYLGWKDPFSEASYSARQRSYNQALKDGVYTPQMVVNGTNSFVGSRRGQATLAIRKALEQASLTRIELERQLSMGGSRKYSYKLTGLQPKQQLVLALVEEGLERAVSRGENRGKTLQHTQVVRHLEAISPDQTGQGVFTLSLPEDVDPAAAKIICFVQSPQLGPITGAIQVPWEGDTAGKP